MRDSQRLRSIDAPGILPLLVLAVMATYLLTVVEGFQASPWIEIRCPDWLFCQESRFVANPLLAAVGSGRGLIGLLVWPVVLTAAGVAWWRDRSRRWIARPLYFALPLLGLQGLLGSLFRPFPSAFPAVSVYLASVLLIQGLVVTSARMALERARNPAQPDRLVFKSPFARLTLVTLAVVFTSMISGFTATLVGGEAACPAWPLCGSLSVPDTFSGWVAIIHRLAVGGSTLVVIWLGIQAWRTQRQRTSVLVGATAVTGLFLAQGLVGALRVVQAEANELVGLHSVTGAALWGVLVGLAVQVGLNQQIQAGFSPLIPSASWKTRARDFIALTKPLIVALLLFTTYGGMVVAGRSLPSLSLTFWTLLGGALAAGGSSAINQYIDRHLDRMMSRTSRRPLAAGRLTPAEGLAFGVALCLAAFFLLAGFVNLLAALLSLVGMLYYVVLYSLLLKRASVQNIVIGGGAGAIPPLVGWAAVTGGLTWSALMLFVLIFFWTPPHFWALALVRRNDYARAGVPMLPVVRGERETRRQILLYTLALVVITLVLPMFGIGGLAYFWAALFLGAVLLRAAWRVWKGQGNKLAWMMYRYSSMYLAFIFLALMVDALI